MKQHFLTRSDKSIPWYFLLFVLGLALANAALLFKL